MIQSIPYGIAAGVLVIQIVILLYLVLALTQRITHTNISLLKKIHSFLSRNYNHTVFFISLMGVLGSLFFSEVLKFPPCLLCWYQRIALYPQVPLTYIAILRNERFLKPYLLVLNIIGAIIALYHYIIQLFPATSIIPCSTEGGISCIIGYHFYFGYITVPMMGLTLFIANIIVLLITKKHTRHV